MVDKTTMKSYKVKRAPVPVLFDGMKAVPAWDIDSMVGWTPLSGQQESGIDLYFSRVPWLYRGVVDRADNVSSMPFAIVKNKADFDTSQDYQNKLGFLPDMEVLFDKLEQSLVMAGRAYLFLETNDYSVVKSVKYCAPSSIDEVYNDETGELTGFKRKYGKRGQSKDVPISNIVAVYDPNYCTENGPAKTSAALAALTAAGVLYNADRFIANYFDRGAIKASVLVMDGGSKDEAERLQSWWTDVVTGIKNAWSAFVLRAKQAMPVVIGEGLEGLQNNELTTERRQDIATALGVPESRMWSSAANYATRKEDEQSYYKSTIIPECKTIARAFNTQLFTKEHKLEGYKLVFRSETLELFQEDTKLQAEASKAFVDFLLACPTEAIAIETATMNGSELNDAMKLAIKEMFAKKEENRVTMAEQVSATPPAPEQEEEPTEDDEENEPQPDEREMKSVLSSWRRKAELWLKKTGSANCPFETTIIPIGLQGAIIGQLEEAKNNKDVAMIFTSVWRGYP
jgi:phage portal protein BeeE